MNPEAPAAEIVHLRPARIWYQSFVDPQGPRPYIQRLQERLTAYAAPEVQFGGARDVPPDRYLSS